MVCALQNKIKQKVAPIPNFVFYIYEYNGLEFGVFEIFKPKYIKPALPTRNIQVGTNSTAIKEKTLFIRRDSSNEEATDDEQVLIYKWLMELNMGNNSSSKILHYLIAFICVIIVYLFWRKNSLDIDKSKELPMSVNKDMNSASHTDSLEWTRLGFKKGKIESKTCIAGVEFYYPALWDMHSDAQNFIDARTIIADPQNEEVSIFVEIDPFEWIHGTDSAVEWTDFYSVYDKFKKINEETDDDFSYEMSVRVNFIPQKGKYGGFGLKGTNGYPCIKRIKKYKEETYIEYVTFVNGCSLIVACYSQNKILQQKYKNYSIEELFHTILSSINIYTY